MKNHNPYLEQINTILPRLLALYNTNPLSQAYGLGDRYFWAWKLIDFTNATYQGAAHGLARLIVNEFLPSEVSEAAILRRIESIFLGSEKIRDKNGSMAEAFPFESSFCVTALVAFDLLSAIELLHNRIDENKRQRYLDIVRPMINFLRKADETHAVISNHLATAAAALYKWEFLTDEGNEKKAKAILSRLLAAQSKEGWFKEYEGADPGYQSLCVYYLADIHRIRPDLGLLEPLRRSMQFLWLFVHPDGSFGGYYGSRNARFYCPAGIELLSDKIPEAKVIAEYMRASIANHTTVTLDGFDDSNIVPFFNAYCQAAEIYEKQKNIHTANTYPSLPFKDAACWRRNFTDAGLLVDKGEKHYAIISWHKGGVCYHFNLSTNTSTINTGVAAISRNFKYYSTQAYQISNEIKVEGNTVTITAPLVAVKRDLPTPFKFILLRLACVTVMKNSFLGNLIKKFLVKILITGKKVARVKNCRVIHLGNEVVITDKWQGPDYGFKCIKVELPFSAIHMASQGYWQKQDDKK